jgi:hypothetical protein
MATGDPVTRRRPGAGLPMTPMWDNEFQRVIALSMRVVPSSIPNAGRGVVWAGTSPLPAKRLIGVYAGRVYASDATIRDTSLALDVRKPRPHVVVALRSKGGHNWTRFINDPWRTRRKANVEFTDRGRLKTLRRIAPGEELFVHYGRAYCEAFMGHGK